MTQIIYVTCDCDYPISEFERLTDNEKLHVAKNDNEIHIYSLEGFQQAFNDEFISDLGYIYIINI